jgi:hypothetical protein
MNKKTRQTYAQTFRFPPDVWQQLRQSAEENVRSLNAELVWILRGHFSRAPARTASETRATTASMD